MVSDIHFSVYQRRSFKKKTPRGLVSLAGRGELGLVEVGDSLLVPVSYVFLVLLGVVSFRRLPKARFELHARTRQYFGV